MSLNETSLGLVFVQVYEGGQVMLTGDYISGNDPDSSVRQLIVVLEALPHFGVIQDNVPGQVLLTTTSSQRITIAPGQVLLLVKVLPIKTQT